MREGRLANACAALLLGGASARMGTDKAALRPRALGARPLARVLAERLSALFEQVLLVGGDPPPGTPGRPVADPEGPRCALRGLVGALAAAPTERVLVVATDLPGLTPELVLALLAAPEADVVLPRTDKPQPLCAVYRRDAVLPGARARLAQGDLAVSGLLQALRVETLEGEDLLAVDPAGLALCNVNTPEQLAAFEARAADLGISW